jgi:hypothetical protein
MLWQRKLELPSSDVLDIVQYGSSVIEGTSPNDIDIAVIFKRIPLKEQLSRVQEIKRMLKSYVDLPIHAKPFDLEALFDESNFAREGIFFYGMGLVSHRPFSNRFSLDPRLRILYSLDKLPKKDKVRFHYLLKGKKGFPGMLDRNGGEMVAPGMIEISPRHELVFLIPMKAICGEVRTEKIFLFKS